MFLDKIEIFEHQKKIIEEKTELNFNEELKNNNKGKKSFSKTFRNDLDVLIAQFYRDGIQFYGFTVDLLSLKKNDPNLWKETHEEVELLISEISQRVELVEFCYISIELHQEKRLIKRKKNKITKEKQPDLVIFTDAKLKDLPHLHGIIGVRTILGENDYLDIEMKKIFRNLYEHRDIKIDRLINPKNIKKYWNYVIKENNFRFHRFVHFGNDYNELYGEIADSELTFNVGPTDPLNLAFSLEHWKYSQTSQITGVKARQPNTKTLITYLLNLYLFHKNCKIHKNKIYEKIENSNYSWKATDIIDILKKNNILIFEALKTKYPMQLGGINTMEIINADWNKTMDEIFENNNYLPTVEFKNDAVEFKDGVYFINENKFLKFKTSKEKLDKKLKNLNCCVFFNKSYHNLKDPKTWLNSIKKTTNSSEDFCIDLARYFHSEPLEILKQKSLVISGSSNTGKTTLVANVIINLFGKENIGMIGKGDNFILEQLEEKNVIIADEFKYNPANRGSLLKLMGNELDLINKKGVQKYGFQNKAPILFMFNPNLNNMMLNDDAFKNRFKYYEFRHEITEYLSNIDELLKDELASILIYCNRLYFKNKNKKKRISTESQKNIKITLLESEKSEDEFPI